MNTGTCLHHHRRTHFNYRIPLPSAPPRQRFSSTIRLYIDPETGEPHIYNHGVEESEVKEVLPALGRIGPAVKDHGSQSAKPVLAVTCGSSTYRILNRVASL